MKNDKDKNILTILKYFSIDWIKKTCWKEIVNPWYEVTTLIEAVEASDNSISGMLLATGEFVQCGYQSHMALFPLLKTARVASGENSLSLMLYLYLLTYLLALWRIASSHKVFRREILADQQSSSRTLENQRHKLNTPILTEMRALLLNSWLF
jgi:hypothetical protein